MKRFFLLTLLCLVAATAEAYDFSLSAPTGQTLYYSYVSSDEVKVVAMVRILAPAEMANAM